MPRREYHFFVYILASRSRTLYIGVTNNLARRVQQHRSARDGTFAASYRTIRLVYFEHFTYVINAVAREKELKSWSRGRKLELITSANATWQDLAAKLPALN